MVRPDTLSDPLGEKDRPTRTNDDVVAIPPDETSEDRPDRSLAEQLVEQARADGKNLVEPGGLLSDLTKQVFETGLEVEMKDLRGRLATAAHWICSGVTFSRLQANVRHLCQTGRRAVRVLGH